MAAQRACGSWRRRQDGSGAPSRRMQTLCTAFHTALEYSPAHIGSPVRSEQPQVGQNEHGRRRRLLLPLPAQAQTVGRAAAAGTGELPAARGRSRAVGACELLFGAWRICTATHSLPATSLPPQNPLLSGATVTDRSGGGGAAQPPAAPGQAQLPVPPPQRRKVPFEKGFSQMDWVRLTQTHPDLAGLGGAPPRRGITLEEVAQHASKDDCWTVLRGKVGAAGGVAHCGPCACGGWADQLQQAVVHANAAAAAAAAAPAALDGSLLAQ